MARSSKAAGGKPGDKTKTSSSNILALIDIEARFHGSKQQHLRPVRGWNERGHPSCCNWWEQEGEIFKKRK